VPISIVRDRAKFKLMVEWLVTMRTATVPTDTVWRTAGLRLLGAARVEVQYALEEWAEGCDVADEHAKGRFGVAPDEDVGKAI
jgi:hypothetical protein